MGPEGTGPPVEACIEVWVNMMVTEAHIGRELPSEGRTPKGLQGPGHRLRESKGGQTDKVHGRHRHAEWV